MSDIDLKYFHLLKSKIESTFNKSNRGSTEIKTWKGQDISNFQEDLMNKVQGRISEKWFYTHLKNNHNKLPRIDMLDLLCQYCGYQNWADFKTLTEVPKNSKPLSKINRSYTKLIIAGIVFCAILIYGLMKISQPINYQFCFIDSDRKLPISQSVDIIELRSNESPIQHQIDSIGCFSIRPQNQRLTFVVKSAYYETDTITRLIKESGMENIKLKTNDYALMIHIFSNSRVKDWKKRRQQLKQMIADNARIYQIDNTEQINIEWFNKAEFINKLTMPINSLQNVEVLETIYEKDQIVEMRFRQANKE